MSIKELLLEKELENFLQRPIFFEIELKDISLINQSVHPLIENLKKLLRPNIDFLISLVKEKNVSLASNSMERLEIIYVEFTNVIINNFDDKASITRIAHVRESYNKLMSFLVSIFHKFDLV
jgi:hypothetical protein